MVVSKVILQGGSGHARVVIDCLMAMKVQIIGIFDPKFTGVLLGIPQLGRYLPDFDPQAKCIVAIGDNATRKDVVEKTTHGFTSAIHPSVLIGSSTHIGIGSMVLHGSIIQPFSDIGNHVILNTGSKVDHDCKIGDFVHIGPGTTLCGNVTLEEGAFVGAGSVVLPGRKIGKWAVIGGGSVVTKDVPDFAVAYGNPARIINKTM